MEWTLLDKVSISLLVIGFVLAIVAASMFSFVKSKKGDTGDNGPQGPAGTAQPTITGTINQLNSTNFTSVVSSLFQYTSTIVLQASGSVASITPGSNYVFGVLSSSITRPSATVYGNAFLDNIHSVPCSVDGSGVITVGPMVNANTFTLFVTFNV